jgi:hypothetical protein
MMTILQLWHAPELSGLTGESPLRRRQELSTRRKQSMFLVLLTVQLF